MSYIIFVAAEIPKRQKTLRWWVIPKDSHICAESAIGDIKWFGGWRAYCFFPRAHCVFEQICMREISDFIEARTKEHKRKKAPTP